MQKLKEYNLHYPNPIKITGFMVDRYNKCLELFGIQPTKLSQFTIDGKGWSSEIAAEKNEIHYLNNGEANPQAILISPLQKEVEIYEPFSTFDKELINLIFESYFNEIKDITKESALCIEFNQGIDVYYDVYDLLKIEKITIEFHLINDLGAIKKEQLNLVAEFNKDNNFVNEKLHKKILNTVRKYGDLRNRNLNLKSLNYIINSFYTKAFGGVFVFKDFANEILIFENKQQYNQAIKNDTFKGLIFYIEQTELFSILEKYIVLELNIVKNANSERYKRIKKHLFTQMFSKTEQPLEQILDNDLLFKRYLNGLDLQGKKRLMAVDRFVELKNKDSKILPKDIIPSDVIRALYQPHSSLLDVNTFLIWKLLSKIAPADPVNMYRYAKDIFFKNYMSYDESYKNWIIKNIRNSKN